MSEDWVEGWGGDDDGVRLRAREPAPREDVGVLRATGVSVEFAEHVAVRDVDLEVAPGTFVAVTGPSGSGKTTFLNVLSGALRPDVGGVTFGGADVRDRENAAALGIVVVPQGNALLTPLTATENIVVPLVALGATYAEARGRADTALAAVGLEESEDHLVEELSGGQQQRVAVARGLALAPKVLIADEPTSDLDAATRNLVVELLAAEARAGAVVVMATHDLEAAAVADEEYHLDEGAISRVR